MARSSGGEGGPDTSLGTGVNVAVLLMALPLLLVSVGSTEMGEENTSGVGPDDDGRINGTGFTGTRSDPYGVLINEYMPAPRYEYKTEWAELYNPTDAPADISGWYLCDSLSRKHTFPGGTVMEPRSHLLVEKTLGLNNGGDSIELYNSTGALADSHTYTDSEYDLSWGRRPDGSHIWTVLEPTPGAPNPDPPRIVINELMACPDPDDLLGEWLELFNNHTGPVRLDGWTITDQDGGDWTLPDVTLPRGCYLVISEAKGEDELDFSDGAGTVHTGKVSRWSNTGDDVLLTDAGGVGIDYITYGVSTYIDPPPPELAWSGRWWDRDIDNYTAGPDNPPSVKGCSITLLPDGRDLDTASAWQVCGPGASTPGGDNSRVYAFTMRLRREGDTADGTPLPDPASWKWSGDGMIPDSLDRIQAAVTPGGKDAAEVVLDNTGNTGLILDLRVDRLGPAEGWWVEPSLPCVRLRPGERTAVRLSITAPDIGCGCATGTALVVNVTGRGLPAWAARILSAGVSASLAGVDLTPAQMTVEWDGMLVAPRDGPQTSVVPEGALLDVSLKVLNEGSVKGGPFTLSLFLDEVRPKRRLGRVEYESITPGYPKRPSFTVDALGIPGDHTLMALADRSGSVEELEERNNAVALPLSVAPTPPPPGSYSVKIVEAYPDSAVTDEPDEHVAIRNTGNATVDVSGWSVGEALEDDPARYATIPEGTYLQPGDTLVLARDAYAYRELKLAQPHLAADGQGSLGRLIAPRGWPTLANGGDEVVVRDGNRHVIDALYYGDGAVPGGVATNGGMAPAKMEFGWSGEPVEPPGEGRCIVRKQTVAGMTMDSNTSADWVTGARPLRTQLFPDAATIEGNVTVYTSMSASSMMDAAVTECEAEAMLFVPNPAALPSPEAVSPAVSGGAAVTVTAALAGDPGDDTRAALDALVRAGSRVLLIDPEAGSGGVPRFDGVSACYAVTDAADVWTCVSPGSGPWSDGDDAGKAAVEPFGRETTCLRITSGDVASSFKELFRLDADPGWTDCGVYKERAGHEVHGAGTVDAGAEEESPVSSGNSWPGPEYARDGTGDRCLPLVFPDAGDPVGHVARKLVDCWGSVDIVVGHSMMCAPLYRSLEILAGRAVDIRLLVRPDEDGWFDGVSSFGWKYSQSAPGEDGEPLTVSLPGPSDADPDAFGDNGPLALAAEFNAMAAGHGDRGTARVLYDFNCDPDTGTCLPLPSIPGIMVIIDERKVIWLDDDVWRGSPRAGGRDGIPRGLGLQLTGEAVAGPFMALFDDLWQASATGDTAPSPGDGHEAAGACLPVISVAYPDTRLGGDPDECFSVSNPADRTIDISGWYVTDSFAGAGAYEGMVRFRPGTRISPGETLCVARNGSAYLEQFGRAPNLWWDAPCPAATPLQTFGRGPALSNSADELFLTDGEGGLVDTLVYGGDERDLPGWSGPPAKLPGEGRLLVRHSFVASQVPGSGTEGWADTDSAADWEGPRIHRPGQSRLEPRSFEVEGEVKTFVSPDSSFGALRELIDSARSSVRVSVYQLMSPHLASLLCNASSRGADVTILLEGGPVGGVTDDQKAVSAMLHEAGCSVLYLVSDSKQDVYGRYDYVHTKYCVVDDAAVAVMSENWVETGVPYHGGGNRGYGIIVHDPGAASYFADAFDDDANVSRPDVAPFDPGMLIDPDTGLIVEGSLTGGGDAADSGEGSVGGEGSAGAGDEDAITGSVDAITGDEDAIAGSGVDASSTTDPRFDECGPPPPGHQPRDRATGLDFRARFKPRSFSGPAMVTPVVSPDTSVHPDTVLGMIAGAKRSILVQQLDLARNWSDCRRDLPNLYLEALLGSARRGVSVRVLLDPTYTGMGEQWDNAVAVKWLNGLAHREGLDLRADLMHCDGAFGTGESYSKVHNKAVIVDSEKVLVSSINWVRGAALLNREAGIIVEHPGVAGYYGEVFRHDWNLSVNRDISLSVTPGTSISLVPGASWTLELHLGLNGELDPSVEPAMRELTIAVPHPCGGWEWGLGGSMATCLNLTLAPDIFTSVPLHVLAPGDGDADPDAPDPRESVKISLLLSADGRTCESTVVVASLDRDPAGDGNWRNASVELVGPDDGPRVSWPETDHRAEAIGAIAALALAAVGLAAARGVMEGWRGKRKRDGDGDKRDGDGDKRDGNGEKWDENGEKRDRNGEKRDENGEKRDGNGEKRDGKGAMWYREMEMKNRQRD